MHVNINEKFLSGEEFNDAFWFDFKDKTYDNRIDLIKNILKEKKNCKCIHLGATDHLNLIDKKIKENKWLHKIISENTEKTVGIDINQKAVDYCHSIGWNNIICADIFKDNQVIMESLGGGVERYDYIIAGEMLEHIDNPVQFLKEINNNYREIADKIIITVPNAFSIFNFLTALSGKEAINTDHRYFFTPYTLCKITYIAGMMPEEIMFAEKWGGRRAMLLRKLFKKSICGDRLVMIARLGR